MKRTLVILACCAVLVLAVFALLYVNRSGNLKTVQDEYRQKKDKLDRSQEIAARLPVARQEFLDAKQKLSFLEQGVSSKVYVPTFLRQIEALGKRNNLQVVGVRPKRSDDKPAPVVSKAVDDDKKGDKDRVAKAPPPKPYDELEISIELKGKYWDALKFMQQITSFPKIVAVNDIQISPEGRTVTLASPELSIKVNATAFILKESVPVGKTAERSRLVAAAEDGDKG